MLLITLLTQNAYPATQPPLNAAQGLCGTKGYYEQIRKNWFQLKPKYQKWVSKSTDTPLKLYTIQNETNNLLKYAGYCQDNYILNELSMLYLKALDTLDETDKYIYTYYPYLHLRRSEYKLKKKQKMWLDRDRLESLLVSSQFLYLISESLAIISQLEPKQHTSAMKEMLARYPKILHSHYQRWIFDHPGPFQVRGWGCKVNGRYVQTGMNHQEFIAKKRNLELGNQNSPLYCNAILDVDMWIIAGVVNFIAAHKNIEKSTPISPDDYDNFINYIRTGVKLLESRVTYKLLQNWNGRTVQGANFDLGVWDDHSNYNYIGCNLSTYPKQFIDAKITFKRKGVGWDLSHARRFVHVFDTLYRNKKITGLNFPDDIFMTRLANQFLYGSFNGDFTEPLFANFMDGTNGWYRIGYLKRQGFGYGPWDMSISSLTGGYGFWSRYNNNFEKLYRALLIMTSSRDPAICKHTAERYEKNLWKNYLRKHAFYFEKTSSVNTQRIFIQFLPSLCFITNLEGAFPIY